MYKKDKDKVKISYLPLWWLLSFPLQIFVLAFLMSLLPEWLSGAFPIGIIVLFFVNMAIAFYDILKE